MNHHEKKKHGNDDLPDPEQIGEILDVVSQKVPHLLREISDILYGEGSAKKYAGSVATFYKELKASGMTDAEAFALTQQYMSALNVGKTMGDFGGSFGSVNVNQDDE